MVNATAMLDTPLATAPGHFTLFAYLLTRLCTERCDAMVQSGSDVTRTCLEPGQCAINISRCAHELDQDRRTVAKRLQHMEQLELIQVQKHPRYMVITVRDWQLFLGLTQGCTPSKERAQDAREDVHEDVHEDAHEHVNEESTPYINILYKKTPFPPRFVRPSLEDLRSYIQKGGYLVDPECFLAYYDSVGWMVGKKKMKDWRAAVRGWHAREKKRAAAQKGGDQYRARNYDGSYADTSQRRCMGFDM